MKKRIKDAIEILDDRLATLEEMFAWEEDVAEPVVMDSTPNDLIQMLDEAAQHLAAMRDEMEFLFVKMEDTSDFVEDYNDNEETLCDRCNRRLSRKERNR